MRLLLILIEPQNCIFKNTNGHKLHNLIWIDLITLIVPLRIQDFIWNISFWLTPARTENNNKRFVTYFWLQRHHRSDKAKQYTRIHVSKNHKCVRYSELCCSINKCAPKVKYTQNLSLTHKLSLFINIMMLIWLSGVLCIGTVLISLACFLFGRLALD